MNTTPSFRYLLDASKVWLQRPPSADPGGEDDSSWDEIRELAYVHGLEPLLHLLPADRRLPAPPDELAERFQQAYFENYVFNRRALELLDVLAAAAHRRGIPLVAIKGPAALARYYRDPALRIMVDLDLLCREQDLAALVESARQLGFTSPSENATYHLALQHPEAGLVCELHFDLYEFLLDRRALHARIFDRAEKVELEGASYRVPCREHELLIESAHLANHDFQVPLKSLLDMAAGLLDADLDSALLQRELEAVDLAPEYALAEGVCAELFSLEPSEVASDSVVDLNLVMTIVDQIAEVDQNGAPAALQELATRSGWRQKLSYLAHLLVPPPSRLRSAQADTDQSAYPFLLGRHLAATFRRGRSKLRQRGVAGAPARPSAKQRLYQRRR